MNFAIIRFLYYNTEGGIRDPDVKKIVFIQKLFKFERFRDIKKEIVGERESTSVLKSFLLVSRETETERKRETERGSRFAL